MISLDKYAKTYGDIPYPENISEKQAKSMLKHMLSLVGQGVAQRTRY